MAFDQAKFLARFVSEAREHCTKLSEGLLALEGAPADAELLNAIFRSAHTIKGSARMMKLTGVSELAHGMEDVLDAARNGRLGLSSAVSDILLRGVDALLAMLERIPQGQQPEAPAALCEELKRVAAGQDPGQKPSAVVASPEQAQEGEKCPAAGTDAAPLAGEFKEAAQPGAFKQAEYLRVNAAKLDDLVSLMGEIISEHSRFKKASQQLRDIERSARQHLAAVSGLLNKQGAGSGECEKLVQDGAAFARSLRQARASINDGVMMQDHLIAELQDTSLKLRMLPLSTVFDPLRRTVRDLARECGKEINFEIEGRDTELDRKITERIGDSLLHMIRNSMDHGLESAEEREAAGKPRKGTISLSAFYDSGGVTIALSDDGKGLPTEKIRDKALAKRLYDAETLGRMSRAEINNLIFLPGFSTSPIITDLSGRGVGMDVVRRNIVDELKGTVVIKTEEGQGTTFLLRLPLNLAVFPLFLVRTAQTVSALPATFIGEMLFVAREEIIEIVDKRAIRLREQIVPVEDLAAVLKVPRGDSPLSPLVTVVIVRDGESRLGLVVDEILGREEMMVKPLPAHLHKLRIVIGGTIGEGGGIVNVLHVPEVMRMARELSDSGRKAAPAAPEMAGRILVVDDSINTREIEKSILEAYGYAVDTAEDGQEALEKMHAESYDLVVTDVEMPRLDGFSLTEQLRADQRYKNVPVIIVTSLEKESDKRRGITVGADAYIVKRAFDQSNLLDTVKSLIG